MNSIFTLFTLLSVFFFFLLSASLESLLCFTKEVEEWRDVSQKHNPSTRHCNSRQTTMKATVSFNKLPASLGGMKLVRGFL